MYPSRSSRSTNVSTKRRQRSPSPNEEVTRYRLRGKRQRTGLRTTKADEGVVTTNEERVVDIIDLIDSTHDAKHAAKKDEEKYAEVADKGLDDSDEDCCSVASSTASGPSVLHNTTAKKLKPLQGVCSACWKLYQKAKKMKAPIKNKLLDTDPKSLTCDQWVLIKTWRPRRLLNARGKLLTHVQLVKKRLIKNHAQRTDEYVGEGERPACSRLHTFLQRNLRRRTTSVPEKTQRKKNRRKWKRNDPQGPRVTKQQHNYQDVRDLPSAVKTDHSRVHRTSSPAFERWSEQEMDSSEDTHLTMGLTSASVTQELTTEPREVQHKQKAPQKRAKFRELLTQMRGNSSMIVRETR